MQDRKQNGEPNTSVVFEVRHVEVTPTAQIPWVLQYVRAALETVGHGAVYATPTGLQITAPVELVVHLQATIEEYQKIDLSHVLGFTRKLYHPAVVVQDHAVESALATMRDLGLCPPEMSYSLASYSGQKAIVFSGPKEREAFYKSHHPTQPRGAFRDHAAGVGSEERARGRSAPERALSAELRVHAELQGATTAQSRPCPGR